METRVYYESQRFSQWWIWTILGGIFAFIVYSTISQLVFNQPVGTNPPSNTGAVVLLLFYSVFLFFFWRIRLTTQMSSGRIHLSFWPFLSKEKNFSELERFEIIDRGFVLSHGIRISKYGWVYTIKGPHLVRLFFKDGKNWNIGTSKPKEIENYLNVEMKRKDI